jgi:hypothetical protein
VGAVHTVARVVGSPPPCRISLAMLYVELGLWFLADGDRGGHGVAMKTALGDDATVW